MHLETDMGVRCSAEIEIDDGEFGRPCGHGTYGSGGNNMYAGEGVEGQSVDVHPLRLHISRGGVGPCEQTAIGTTNEIARGAAVGGEQGGLVEGVVALAESTQVNVVEDIDVMNEEWNVGRQERGCLLDGSPCVEELLSFITDTDVDAEVVGVQVTDNLFGEVMDVDHNVRKTSGFESLELVGEEGFSTQGNESLGHRVGERLQACAESGSEDQGATSLLSCP